MAVLPSPLPFVLSPIAPTATFTRSGVAWNYAIGSLPFMSAASEQNPIVRTLAPYRKQQFDSSMEPGEQSLDGWWLRSQSTFHHGAGQLYGDPGVRGDDADPARFYTSYNVDPWTPGQVSLLKTTVNQVTQPCKRLIGYVDPTHGDAVFGVTDTRAQWRSLTGLRSLNEVVGVSTLQSCAFDGTTFYVSTLDGVYTKPITDFAAAWTKVWDIPTKVNVIGFVKRRLVLATSDGVYELTGAGPVLPTPKWVPKPLGITPTGITEAGNAIFVSYYINNQSEILKFTLDGTGTMPTLSGGSTAAALPYGELVRSIQGYLDRYLLIGTTLGPRVAAVDGTNIEYGPLLLSTPAPVLHWTTRDRFAWFTASRAHADGLSGLYRVDLSVDLGNLQFAYAPDLVLTNTDDVGAVAHCGTSTRKAVTNATQLRFESNNFVTSGYVESSRIRYATLEPKVYKLLRVRGPLLAAGASATVVDPLGSVLPVIGYAAGTRPGSEDHSVPLLAPAEYLSVRLNLTCDGPATSSAILAGWQLKALPATPRQKLIKLPMYCFDYEKDRFGVKTGAAGSAEARLRGLEQLARNLDVVSFQDLDSNLIERAVIEEIEFVQTTQPSSYGGWGGRVTVTLRTV